MLFDELTADGHVQHHDGALLFTIPHPPEIVYDHSILHNPMEISLNQENSRTEVVFDSGASDYDVNEKADALLDGLAPSKVWVGETESNILWIEQMRSCFLTENDALPSTIVHAIQDPQSLFLNEFSPRSLHTEPYKPSIDSIYTSMKQTESSVTIRNDGKNFDQAEPSCKDILKRQTIIMEKLPTLSGPKEPVRPALPLQCDIADRIPKHASCRFWSTSHIKLKLSKKLQQCKSRELETKEETVACFHCICSAAESNWDLVSEYDVWLDHLSAGLSNPPNVLKKRILSAFPNPLPYCYNPSQVFMRSRLNENTFFTVNSHNLMIAESGKWIRIRLLLPERTPVFGVPPGQFVVLTIQTQCRCHPEKSPSSPGRDLTISRPLFPITACDTLHCVDFMWMYHCRSFDTHQEQRTSCEDPFGCGLRQLGTLKNLNVRGPFGQLLYRGSGCFSLLHAFTSQKVTKMFKSVLMIGLGFGMFPLFTIFEQANREMEQRTKFSCVQLHVNAEPCLLSEQFADIVSKTGCCSYTECKIEFSMDWNLEIFENDFSALLPSCGIDTLVIVCVFVPFRHHLMRMLRRLGYLEYDYYTYTTD